MENLGFALTVLWLSVLFIGGAIAGKTGSAPLRKALIAVLILIPVSYIIGWLFT